MKMKIMDKNIERCLNERKLEEKLFVYLDTEFNSEGDFVHHLKDNAPDDVKEYYPKWLKSLKCK